MSGGGGYVRQASIMGYFYLREQVKEWQVLFFLIQRMLTSILRLRMLKVFKAKMFRMKI